jgi:TfoX/Sxy family transcriptional regulator of competence genes
MSFDAELAERVRAGLTGAGAVREIKMFGGMGFMLNGNMVAAASKRGLLVRVGKERYRDALARPGARPMEMRGRAMEGYVYVDPAGISDGAVKAWLQLAVAFVETLPAKDLGQKPARKQAKRG